MKSTIVKELLDLGDAFEQQHPNEADQTTANFLAWASGRNISQPSTEAPINAPQFTYYSENLPVSQTYLAHLVTNLARYFRGYVRKALEMAPLLSFDDYIALVILAGRGSMIKTDLVEATINEKTSGMLVIKRLIDNGFVTQTEDESDKRTRKLSITDAGLAMLHAIQPAINEATALFTGDLTEAERNYLNGLLARLDRFHEPIYLTHHDASLDELLRLVGQPVKR